MIAKKLKTLTLSSEKENIEAFVNKITASQICQGISYLFFLNPKGRYISDAFYIKKNEEHIFAGSENSINNLKNWLKFLNFKKTMKIEEPDYNAYISLEKESENFFEDPRGLGYINLSKEEKEINAEKKYEDLRIKNEIAEFDDFEHEKSIILEYGKISKFISTAKGCYPGQELMNRTRTQGSVRKTVLKTTSSDNAIKVLSQNEKGFLVFKRI